MHGLGDTCDGWLAPTLHEYLPALHDKVKYILPSAPNQPVTLNMGMTMPSWSVSNHESSDFFLVPVV